MKFEIVTDGFERRGEVTPYATIPLRSTASGRDFFLNASAYELLELPEGVHNFEEEFGALPSKKKRDLKDGLILLSAFGAAKVSEEESDKGRPYLCRVAGERDYKTIAAFINSDAVRRLGSIPKSETGMNEDMIRARQFNNLEYNFLCFKEGKLFAVLLAGMSAPESFSVAFRLCGIAVSSEADDAEAKIAAEMLLDYAVGEFQKEFSICRYLCFAEEDALAELLKAKGFAETAHLIGEAEGGGDVTVYDWRFMQC